MRNKIIVFGDSITFGAWDMELGGWVNRLRLSIDNDDRITSAHVFNMGISRQNVGEILERFQDECSRRVMEGARNIVILAAGINDAQMENGVVMTDETTFRNNVTELIRQAKSAADHVLYIGLTRADESRVKPVKWDKTRSWKNEDIMRYDSIIEEIAKSEGIDYLYAQKLTDPEENWDGLHPGASGHSQIAEAVRRKIDDYLGL